jgi:hypothetical protein
MALTARLTDKTNATADCSGTATPALRLLVVTEFPPNAAGGGPAVVRQMLKHWPVEQLFWWSCFPEVGKCFGQEVRQLFCARLPAKLYPRRRLAMMKSAFLETVWTRYAAAHLRKALRTTRPDAVWVIPHNWSIPPMAKALIDEAHPYHITVQDYVDVHNNPQAFGRQRCARMAALADELYARAVTRDATSHPMIADLRARTGKDATQMLHAGLEPADFTCLEGKTPGTSPLIRIAYAGTILVEEAFALFVSAVDSIRGGLAKKVEIHLFGAHTYAGRPWFRSEWMTEHGNLRELELLERLRACDWGFAPMSLTDDDPRYNRFSFPTKFITYLAAGLPIITIGHPESSVSKMAAQYDLGFSTSAATGAELSAQLKTALSTPAHWEHHREAVLRCARVEFDAVRMRQTLHACFSKCAKAQMSA